MRNLRTDAVAGTQNDESAVVERQQCTIVGSCGSLRHLLLRNGHLVGASWLSAFALGAGESCVCCGISSFQWTHGLILWSSAARRVQSTESGPRGVCPLGSPSAASGTKMTTRATHPTGGTR